MSKIQECVDLACATEPDEKLRNWTRVFAAELLSAVREELKTDGSLGKRSDWQQGWDDCSECFNCVLTAAIERLRGGE